MPSREFEDHPSGGILLEPRGEISFFPNERCAVSVYFSYRYIRGAHGPSHHRHTYSDTFTEWMQNTAGAGFTALDAGIALKVFF
jgi:hypothetical protein